MKRKKTLVVISVIVIAAAALAAVAFGKRGEKAEVVKTAAVSKGELKSYLSTNAVIESKNSKSYMGAAQLTVKNINVKVGDQVKSGQVMLDYDISDLSTSVTQSKLQYNNSVLQRDDLLNQKKQIDDTIANLDAQINQLEASKNPSDMATLQGLKQKREAIQPVSDEKVKLMDNSVALSKLAYDSASSRLEKYKDGIKAESDGIVTAVNAVEGSSLNPAQPAIVVQQLDALKAVISLGKYDALKVKLGQEAILKNGDKTYSGAVAFINPATSKAVSAGGQTTSLDVEVDVNNPGPDLKVGFDVNIDI